MTKNLTEKNDAVSLNEGLLAINQAALKFAKVSEYEELFKIIVETLKELAHVKSVVVAMYDAQKKVSRVKYFEIDSLLLNEIMTLFGGKKITEIELPISDETFEIIRNSPVSMLPTLNEATFGSISKITGKVIQAVQGIDRYVGLAYFVDDELFGTTLLGLEKTSVDPSKEILYSFSQLVSLTLKRLRTTEELKESELQYRNLANAGPSLIWTSGTDKLCNYFNDTWLKFTGRSIEQEMGNGWAEGVHPDDFDRCLETYVTAFDKREHFEMEYRLRHASGEYRIILDIGTPNFDRLEEFIGYIGHCFDITDRKKAETELRKSEEKYRLIAENMGNVVTMLDMELNYIYVTPNIEKVQGFTVEEYLKKSINNAMTPESYEFMMKEFEEEKANELSGTADPKRNRVIELEEYRKDGSTMWMENVLSFVRDETGKPIGILSVSRNVTERKMALEEKAKLTQQLYHAQKMESVGTLAGGIAHDFNNLLQVIGGYTSMLLSVEGRDHSEVDRLKIIEKAVDRASELVSNLLTFSRKNVSMKKKVDLNSEITAAVNMLERTIPKMVKITTEFDPSIPKISADPIQIEQILLNLGKNSSDAMPDGGTILIKTKNIENKGSPEGKYGKLLEGKYVAMTFADTGLGMDKETKDHVFDPFFTTKEVGKGTGLGLASVYGIVESHGGHIHCESELGKGTVFTIYFPADVIGNDNEKVMTQKTKKLEGSERVLIVDDEKNIRELYSSALGEFGYKVLTAQSGEEALIIFKENHHEIDILILDLGMPGMGGFKCMLEMKKIVPDSKIIIASGYSEVFQTEDLLKSGASGFIQKPFKLKNVLEKIREVLDGNIQPEHN